MTITALAVLPGQASADTVHDTCGPRIAYPGPEYMLLIERQGEGDGWVDLNDDGGVSDFIAYATAGGLSPGDTISLDWDNDTNHSERNSCKSVVPSGYSTTHTLGVNYVNGRHFRACKKADGDWKCTSWW